MTNVVGTFDTVGPSPTEEDALIAIFNVHSKLTAGDQFGDSRRIALAAGSYALERVIWLCEYAVGTSKVLYDTHTLAVKALARGEI